MSSDQMQRLPLTTEQVEWRYARATAGRPQTRSYAAAIAPEIAHLKVVLPPGLAIAAEDASREIARFDTEMGGRGRAVRLGPPA